MLGCLLATYGVITLIFGYPSKEARRRRQRLSEILEDLERTCRPPVAWDHFEVCSASVMGPPVRQ
jgi:hypothetical protein